MTMDFVTYQLQQKGDKEIHSVPGVLVEHAARTMHRHRQRDLLAMYLSFSGEHRLPEDEIIEIQFEFKMEAEPK